VDLASANYGLCLEALSNETEQRAVQEVGHTRSEISRLTGTLSGLTGALRTLQGSDGSAWGAAGTAEDQKVYTDAAVEIAAIASGVVGNTEGLLTVAGELLVLATRDDRQLDDSVGETLVYAQRVGDVLDRMMRRYGQDANGTPEPIQPLVAEAAKEIANLHAAMSGLVRGRLGEALSFAFEEYGKRAADQERMAYFYCRRGEELFARLPAELRAAPTVQRAEALVLRLLGSLLEKSGWEPIAVKRVWDWHCSSEDFAESGVAEGEATATYGRGPHAAVALGYYKRAAALLPDDPAIRCSAARVARAMENEAPMLSLKDSVEARASLGREWLDYGYANRNSKYLKLALDEYGRAIARNPYHVDSLNDFAYAAYLWRLFNVSGDDIGAPIDPRVLAEAETYARRAVALTARGQDVRKRLEARSTLGEVLLAQDRTHEAVDELHSALQDLASTRAGVEHAVFDELRWDLRQAALCAAIVDERTGFTQHAQTLRAIADDMIKTIKVSDRGREYQRFGNVAQSSHALETSVFCAGVPDRASRSGNDPRFVLAKSGIKYAMAPQRMCTRLWVTGKMEGAIEEDLHLDIRGGGGRFMIPFSPDGSTDPKAFADFPKNTHHYYFAQLTLGEGGEPLSAMLPLQTFEPVRGDCGRNQLILTFERSNPGK